MYLFSFIGRQNVSENAKKSFLGTTKNLTKNTFFASYNNRSWLQYMIYFVRKSLKCSKSQKIKFYLICFDFCPLKTNNDCFTLKTTTNRKKPSSRKAA